MPNIAALYRYPIKGLEPELLPALRWQKDGRIAGDRVLAFRYADALTPQDRDGHDYWSKGGGLCVRDYPALTLLRLRFDAATLEVEITGPDGLLARGDLSAAGRARLADAVTEYVQATPEGPRVEAPGRLPLHLIGDGVSARFQDRARGFVSLHNRASLRALEAAVGQPLDEVRFRSNIALDGLDAWQEDELIGKQVRIGSAVFEVHGAIVRCLATHANPDTGVYDVPVMQTLTRVLGRERPSFGVLLLPIGTREGEVRVGDTVELNVG